MTEQKPVFRKSRQQQLLEWDFSRDTGRRKFEYFLPDSYLPCTKAIEDLTPITLAELKPETKHGDRVLFVRVIDTAIRDAAVQNLVEDETGTVDQLALYNVDPAARVEDVLAEDGCYAVKDPFYSEAVKGKFVVRVDHPSDLVELSPASSFIPKALQSEDGSKSASDWKTEGNAAYKTGSYRAAARAYTNGVNACGEQDLAVKQDILRNRSIVNTYLKRFEDAKQDAESSVISDADETGKSLNSKAHWRAGRAAYEMRHYDEAKSCFEKVQELTPNDSDAAKELSRIDERMKEQTTGEYDFDKMSRSASEKHNMLDYANFTSNTAVQAMSGRGNGLVAAKSLKPGDLMICEKAFGVAFDSDNKSGYSFTALNSKSQRRSTGTQTILAFKLIEKVLHNSEAASQLFELYDGGFTTPDSAKTSLQRIDGLLPVDTFRVHAITDYNTHGLPNIRSTTKAAQKQLQSSGFSSTGLWRWASYINHACDGNVMRSFIGDMMIVRATKDIAEGEEICMPYRLPHANNDVTQKELESVWGFRCDCQICQTEAATPAREKKEREQLVEKVTQFLAQNKDAAKANKKTLAEAEKLYANLESTYSKEQFEDRPRLGLVGLGHWLLQAYNSQSPKAYPRLFETSLNLLRNCGYIIKLPPPSSFAKEGMNVERTYCQIEPRAVEAAMYATHALLNKGQASAAMMGKFLKTLAEELWLVMYGEMRGFEERFKEVGS